MENIERAVERARTLRTNAPQGNAEARAVPGAVVGGRRTQLEERVLSSQFLQSHRIISHLVSDPRARSFDMLRTQLLQTMDAKDWQVVAITSPTAHCGKTVAGLNLAISIARQPERAAFIVDLDFQRPKLASYLGIEPVGDGALGVLKGKADLSQSIIRARIDDQQQFLALPTGSTVGSAEIIASRATTGMMEDLRRGYPSHTIIVDLPPILTSDDVIAMLPQVDCVILVAAVGVSTVAQIKECSRHLQAVEVVRIVLNKVPEANTRYGYYY
jgi:protein-tyrosine kinase